MLYTTGADTRLVMLMNDDDDDDDDGGDVDDDDGDDDVWSDSAKTPVASGT